MKNIKLKEFLCIVILIVFIFSITGRNKLSNADAKDVFHEVCSAADVSGLSLRKNENFKKEFGFGVNEFDEVYYMSSESVMDVREVLLVKFSEGAPVDELMESIRKRVEERETLFKGYAPEAGALLEKNVLEKKGGFVMFAVSKNPKQALSAFRKAL